MSPITARRVDEDEDDDLLEQDVEELDDDDEAVAERKAAPAVSDSRRRRMIKRGEISADEPQEEVQVVRKDRPTPSTREDKEKEKSKNFIARSISNLREYWADTRGELLKVAWPTRQETIRLTWIVIIVTAISAAFLGIISFLFSILTTQIAGKDNSLLAGIFAIALTIVVTGLWLFRDRLFPTLE